MPSGLIAASQTSPAWPRKGFWKGGVLQEPPLPVAQVDRTRVEELVGPRLLARPLLRVGQCDPLKDEAVRSLWRLTSRSSNATVFFSRASWVSLCCSVRRTFVLASSCLTSAFERANRGSRYWPSSGRGSGARPSATGDREGRRQGPTSGPSSSASADQSQGPCEHRTPAGESLQIVGQIFRRRIASCRSFSRHFRTIVSRSMGNPPVGSGTGMPVRPAATCSSVSSTVAARNGGRPVSSSYKIAPRAYTSVAGPIRRIAAGLLRGHVARRPDDRVGPRQPVSAPRPWPARSRRPWDMPSASAGCWPA